MTQASIITIGDELLIGQVIDTNSAWMAQELLSTFADEIGGVTLVPGTGGIFEVSVADALLWERKRDGGFPDIKVLKQLVRDRIAPERDLGHSDRASPKAGD